MNKVVVGYVYLMQLQLCSDDCLLCNWVSVSDVNDNFQLVLLGDSGVGKSCIVLRFVRGQFDPTSKV